MRQEETITKYRENSESPTAALPETQDEMQMEVFKNGLKVDIWVDHRMMRVGSLKELMNLAHQIEERNLVLDMAQEDF